MNDDLILDEAVPAGSVLRVSVGGDGLKAAATRFKRTTQALVRADAVQPHFSVSFQHMASMLAVFTPKRWELIAALREAGPQTVRALAQRLERDYKNVHGDVAALEQWMAVQRLPDGRVHVPWREIVMDVKLPDALAQAA